MSDRNAVGRRVEARCRPIEKSCARPCENSACEGCDAPDVAGYIADLTAQLETMAREAGLDLVGYLLEMARAESEAAGHCDERSLPNRCNRLAARSRPEAGRGRPL